MSALDNPLSLVSPSDPEQTWADPQIVAYWSKCEDVAMHFNELLMNFRMRALGGLALLASVTTGFLSKATVGPDDWRMVGGALALTTAVWISVALLDMHYYMLLLSGAVQELKRVEDLLVGIRLSTTIEGVVQNAGWTWKRLPWRADRPRRLVMGMYVLPGLVLAALTIYCFDRGGSHVEAARKATPEKPSTVSVPSAPPGVPHGGSTKRP